MNEGETTGVQGYHLKFLGLVSPSLIPLNKNLFPPQPTGLRLPRICKSNTGWAHLLLSPSRTWLLQEPETTALPGSRGLLPSNAPSGTSGGK